MRKPKAIVFDLGDTLIRSESFNPIDGVRGLLKYGDNPNNVPPEQIQEFATQVLKDLGELEKSKLLQLDNRSFTRLIYGVHGITFDKSPEELDLIFIDHAEKVSLIDGVKYFLEFLKSKNIRMAILSNTGISEQALRVRLKRYEIEDYFEFFIGSTDYCIRKPDRRIFDLALAKLKLSSDDVWYIGNKFEYDVMGAYNASMFPVWFNENGKKKTAEIECLEVSQYSELKDIVDELL